MSFNRAARAAPLHSLWNLDPRVDFLNHGSFGACPREVLEVQRGFQDALELEPIRFLAPERDLEPKLDTVRAALAKLVSIDPQDLVWVRNATEGVNAVLRSMRIVHGDEFVSLQELDESLLERSFNDSRSMTEAICQVPAHRGAVL